MYRCTNNKVLLKIFLVFTWKCDNLNKLTFTYRIILIKMDVLMRKYIVDRLLFSPLIYETMDVYYPFVSFDKDPGRDGE